MEIVIIAAVAEAPGTAGDRLIGNGLDLPWRIPADLQRFKRLTLGNPLVMGRRTFESLLYQFGGPLPGRDNVVLTQHPMHTDQANIHVYSSLLDAVEAFADRPQVFIGGGARVYSDVLDAEAAGSEKGTVRADRLELTLVEGEFQGDTYFPPYRHLIEGADAPFEQVRCERYPATDGVSAFRFETYTRK